MKYPKVFTDKNFEYPEGTKQPDTAVADGCSGWGGCMAGSMPPEFFGIGMCKIGKITGKSSLPKSLDSQAEEVIRLLDRKVENDN